METREGYTETESRIFEAALGEFSRKGKDGARMQEIADSAGINKALLHYYFRSKDRLYEEVFGYVFRRFIASFAETSWQDDSFADTLQAFINGFVDFGKDNLQVIRLMVNENLSGGSALTAQIAQLQRSGETLPPMAFLMAVQRAVARGEIRAVDPAQTVITVISSCLYFLVMYPLAQMISPKAADREAFIEERKKHLFEVLYHGLANPSSPTDAAAAPVS